MEDKLNIDFCFVVDEERLPVEVLRLVLVDGTEEDIDDDRDAEDVVSKDTLNHYNNI